MHITSVNHNPVRIEALFKNVNTHQYNFTELEASHFKLG